MIKILFLIDSLTGGGAEKVLQTLVNNLDQKTFQITVQTITYTNPEQHLTSGIRYKAICNARSKWGKKIWCWWLRLCAQLKWVYPLYIHGNYDIEVAYLECGPTKFLWGSSSKDVLKLAWLHCDLQQRGILVTNRMRNIYQSYDKVICVSQSVHNCFVHLFGNDPPSRVLNNVNDEILIREKAKTFDPPMSECFTFVSVGRLSKEKGLDRLLLACADLRNAGKSFHLLILGDGPEQNALHALRNQLQLESRVTFLGYQENPYPYMQAADCIVCTSLYEGMSTVITESLILGKTILTTHCAGMVELLGNSKYGLIVENSTSGIFQGMRTLLDDPALCQQYEQAAFQRGQSFSKTATVQETECFLCNELMRKRTNL